MKSSRVARLAVVALVLFGGAASACGSKEPAMATSAAGASSPLPPSPSDVLLASVKAFDTTSFTFHINQGAVSGGGKVDMVAKAASFTQTGKVSGTSFSVNFTAIGTDLWMKVDFGAAGNKELGVNKTKWMHIDQTKVTDKTQLPVDDTGVVSIGTSDMFAGVAGVKRTDSTHFSGTVDVTGNGLLSPDKDLLTKVGDKAKAVPFTAVLDTQGRLIALTVDGSTIDPGLSTDATFTGFGATEGITKPVGAIPAPATFYTKFLNS